jgi:hypothetical protein
MKQMIAEEEGLAGCCFIRNPGTRVFPSPLIQPALISIHGWHSAVHAEILEFPEIRIAGILLNDSCREFLPYRSPGGGAQLLMNLKGAAIPPGTWKGRLETSYLTDPGLRGFVSVSKPARAPEDSQYFCLFRY